MKNFDRIGDIGMSMDDMISCYKTLNNDPDESMIDIKSLFVTAINALTAHNKTEEQNKCI